MADAQDLKSWVRNRTCGFESRLRHHVFPQEGKVSKGIEAAGIQWLLPPGRTLIG